MLTWRTRAGLLAATGAALLAAVSPTAASAAPLGTYRIAKSSATYLLAGNNLFPAGVDDGVAAVTLPFRPIIYGKQRPNGNVFVSSNGNVQFGPSPSAAYSNGCLPDSQLSGPALAVYWDDLRIRSASTSPDGVFTKSFGAAPNRKFAISWRGVDYATGSTAVRAEVVFYEGKQYFDMIYSDGDGFGATVGVQSYDFSRSTQFTCNSGRHNVVVPGTRLRYTYS